MRESRAARMAAALVAAAVLVAAWPAFSDWWVGLLRAAGSAAAGSATRLAIPATASPTIPVGVAIIAALALPVGRRILLASGLVLTTLACEMAVVLAGAAAHLSSGAVNVLAGIPVGVPFVWLLIAVLSGRKSPLSK